MTWCSVKAQGQFYLNVRNRSVIWFDAKIICEVDTAS